MMSVELIVLAGLAAGLVGLAKTGIPGTGVLVVPLMAAIHGDAKASVGVLLPMLIIADIFAVVFYRHHAQWDRIRKLFPWVAVGMVGGYLALRSIPDNVFAPFLGALVCGLVVLEFCRQRCDWHHMPHHPVFVGFIGFLTGFSTMTGNVAGPVINIYLLCHGLDKKQFLGSTSWFFLVINCIKIPFFMEQGMITHQSLMFDVWAMPAIIAGAFFGRWIVPFIPQRTFNIAVLLLALVAAGSLFFT